MTNRSVVTALFLALTACGVVGPPVPPETVGVASTVERQKQRDAAEAQKREAEAAAAAAEPALQGQDVDLPPLRPVGTR